MSHKLKTIPLCQLRPGKANIRKTDRLSGVSAMAANIQEKDLLENLVVQIARQPNGHDPLYDVVAGGRRLAALKLLAKRRKIARDHPVRCLLLDAEQSAVEVSLAENLMRVPVHAADQFEAFAALTKEGLSADELGARFGVTPAFVAQRLKLASLSPRLVQEYRAGAMTLEQLTAFTLSDSHAVQEEVWFERAYTDMPAQVIRRLLTQTQVPGTDPRARLIGAQAYVAAGGTIVRDLFDAEDEGYFTDSQLLDRLVQEKLEEAAQKVRGENWQWVEIHPSAEVLQLGSFGRAETVECPLSEADQKRVAERSNRYDELVASLEEEEDETVSAEIDAVSQELNRLQAQNVIWSDEAKSHSGALVFLGQNGDVEIVRGLIKEDANGQRQHPSENGKHSGSRGYGGYSEAVLVELSAQRTAVIRELLAQNPDVALTALLHALVMPLFYRISSESCLSISATEVLLEQASDFVRQSKAAQAFAARHAALVERLPEPDELWLYISELDEPRRANLLAHCVALTVSALHERSGSNEVQVSELAGALRLNMRDWWQPERESFLNRITKEQILGAVSEGVSQQASWRLARLKKERMAREAEKLLVDTTWLPLTLRSKTEAVTQGA